MFCDKDFTPPCLSIVDCMHNVKYRRPVSSDLCLEAILTPGYFLFGSREQVVSFCEIVFSDPVARSLREGLRIEFRDDYGYIGGPQSNFRLQRDVVQDIQAVCCPGSEFQMMDLMSCVGREYVLERAEGSGQGKARLLFKATQ